MHIQLLTGNDAQLYWELRLEALQQSPEAFLMTYEEETKQENPLHIYKESLDSKNRCTYGVFNKDELIAVGTLQLEQPMKTRHKANILSMYVSRYYRGAGIGKMLLQHLIEQARLLQLEQVHLTVVSTNHGAKILYDSLGFVCNSVEEKSLKLDGQYWDEEHMVLVL